MKYVLLSVYIGVFLTGIIMVLRADSGWFGSYYPSLSAGVLVSICSGIAIIDCLHSIHNHESSREDN